MDAQNMQLLLMLIYKLAGMACGLVCVILGYKLFVKGVFGDAGEVNATLSHNSLLVKKAAPGTFFGLFGVVIMTVVAWKGLHVSVEERPNAAPVAASTVTPSQNEGDAVPVAPVSFVADSAAAPAKIGPNGGMPETREKPGHITTLVGKTRSRPGAAHPAQVNSPASQISTPGGLPETRERPGQVLKISGKNGDEGSNGVREGVTRDNDDKH